MTWFKVDDSFGFHGKAVAAGDALALWTRAGAWSAQQLTDGFVPAHMVNLLGGEAHAETLVRVGLWITEPDGFRFHDWADYQPTKAEVEERREKRSRSGRIGGLRSGASRREASAEAHAQASAEASASASAEHVASTLSNPRPDPTRSYSPPVVPSPTREPVENRGGSIPRGTDGFDRHEHHENAKAVCVRWVEERKLPLGAPELLAWCYRLGNGDPWEGQRLVGRHTEAELDSARNPLATVRARLRDATPTRRADADVIQFDEIVGRIG